MSGTPLVSDGRKEYKDEQLLARLIGAAVLLAIAVIVLPFVLDGAGSQHERQPLPAAPQADEVDALLPAAVNEDLAAVVNQAELSAPQPAVEIKIQPPEPVVAVSQSTELPFVTQNMSAQIPSGWNIQVASFVKPANAEKLLQRLNSESLPGYVNPVDGKQRRIYRVFVGPIENQIDALALKNRIDRSYRVESIMVTRN